MARKIIQIATGTNHPDYVECHIIYALCDDGTLWAIDSNNKWEQLPEIPQDDNNPEPLHSGFFII